jgi:hypothetical protein
VNTIVLPCDLHWDVTGITKSDSPPLPDIVLHDEAGFRLSTDQSGGSLDEDLK